MNTEVGKIASLLKTTSEKKTPLQVNLDQFGQKLSILILVFCAILFGISVFRGENIGNAFLFLRYSLLPMLRRFSCHRCDNQFQDKMERDIS